MVQDQKTENLEGSWKNPPVFVHRRSSAISGFVNEVFFPQHLFTEGSRGSGRMLMIILTFSMHQRERSVCSLSESPGDAELRVLLC